MQYLRADSTATILIGPFVDYQDGVTGESGVTLGGADAAEIMKHNGTTFTDISSLTFTHKQNGMYTLALTASETDTEGRLTVFIADENVCLPVWKDFMVVNANVYDSLFAAATTDYLQVDTLQIEGSDATNQINAECDTALSDYDAVVPADLPTNFGDLSITASTGRVDVANIEGADATDQINAACDTALSDYDALVPADLPTNFSSLVIDGSGRVDVSLIEGVDATNQINAACDTAMTDYDAVVPADLPTNFGDLSITASTGRVDVAAVAGTSQTANDMSGDIDTLLTRVVGTLAAGTHNAQSGDAYARLGAPAGASIAADIAENQTDLDAILADTGTDGVVLAADAITSAKIADDAISSEHLATGCLTADAFAADALVAATFATDSITSDALAASAVNEIWDATEAITGDTHSFETILARLYAFFMHKMEITDSSGAVDLKDTGGSSTMASNNISDNDTLTTRTEMSWV